MDDKPQTPSSNQTRNPAPLTGPQHPPAASWVESRHDDGQLPSGLQPQPPVAHYAVDATGEGAAAAYDDAIPGKRKKSPKPRLRRPGFFDEIFRTVLLIIAVTVLADMAMPRSLVDGTSMMPTFVDGERLMVSRVHYLLTEPERGQVVVFNSMRPDEFERGVMLIKRVIGLPGETVSFRENEVYVNGERLDEPYIQEACREFKCPDREITVGDDEYFVMGDNRNVSQDSRVFGAVTQDHLVGMVLFRYWPIDRIGFINPQDYHLDGDS